MSTTELDRNEPLTPDKIRGLFLTDTSILSTTRAYRRLVSLVIISNDGMEEHHPNMDRLRDFEVHTVDGERLLTPEDVIAITEWPLGLPDSAQYEWTGGTDERAIQQLRVALIEVLTA